MGKKISRVKETLPIRYTPKSNEFFLEFIEKTYDSYKNLGICQWTNNCNDPLNNKDPNLFEFKTLLNIISKIDKKRYLHRSETGGLGYLEFESTFKGHVGPKKSDIKKELKNIISVISIKDILQYDNNKRYRLEESFVFKKLDNYENFEDYIDSRLILFQIHRNIDDFNWADFRNLLDSEEIYLKAAIRFSSKRDKKDNFELAILGRKPTKEIFVANIEEAIFIPDVVNHFLNKIQSNRVSSGIFVDVQTFFSFRSFFYLRKYLDLFSYNNKGTKRFKEVVSQDSFIEMCKNIGSFTEVENSLYINVKNRSEMYIDMESLGKNKNDYMRLIFNKNIVLNKYMREFFRTKCGDFLLQYILSTKSVKDPCLRFADLLVPVVDIRIQYKIVKLHADLEEMELKFVTYKEEAFNNTKSIDRLHSLINLKLLELDKITGVNIISYLVENGENDKVEFKETLSVDIKTNRVNKSLENEILKTIAGFLNRDGGTLLVGVSDDGEIRGLQKDLKHRHNKSTDKLLLFFENMFKSGIGEKFNKFVSHKLFEVGTDSKGDPTLILKVDCFPSDEPCFVVQKEFYVRVGNSTNKISGENQYSYIAEHFLKN